MSDHLPHFGLGQTSKPEEESHQDTRNLDQSNAGTSMPSTSSAPPLAPALGPVLAELSPLPGQEDQEPVYYPVNYQDPMDHNKDLPAPPNGTVTSSSQQAQSNGILGATEQYASPNNSDTTALHAQSSTTSPMNGRRDEVSHHQTPPEHLPPRTSSMPAQTASPGNSGRTAQPEHSGSTRSMNQQPAQSDTDASSHDTRSTEMPELPEAPPSRVVGSGYSAYHPVPTVSGYKSEKAKHEEEAERYAELVERRRQEAEERDRQAATMTDRDGEDVTTTKQVAGEETNAAKTQKDKTNKPVANTGTSEKQRMMDQMNANQLKPTDRIKKAEKGQRRVRDPTTGDEIIVKDADPKDFDSTVPTTKGSNILYHAFPPARPPSLDSMLGKLRRLEYGAAAGLFFIWLTVAFGSGIIRFLWRSLLCSVVGFVLMTGINLVARGLDKEMERVRQDMGRQRGEAFSPPMPESVEWLNGLIKLMWGLIDPAMFISVADMIEDILQQSLPGFVDAVRITDLGQGTNPLRITSIRALPDQTGDDAYPRTGWINQGKQVDTKDTAGKDAKEDEAGDYYNFEVAFSYAALPGQGDRLRAKNIHLLIEFFIGMYDWLHIPIPIWIQVEQIFGVVRLRVQFIPEYPYIRNLTFALCGVPAVEVSAIPMSNKLPNILDLPFISSFVKMGIAAGTAELSVPKSMTLNMQDMLSGAAVGDTRAIGVFIITVHYCEGLSAQDTNGTSDPYVVLAYAKFGKPLYSTRIILKDLNPVFEETCVLLLTMDEVKAKEDLAAMLWDSDARSADDLVGRIQIPVEELMLKPNEMHRRADSLMGFEDANDLPGKMHWSIGYFEKAPLLKELERSPTEEEKKAAPAPGKTGPEMEMLPGDVAPLPAKKDLPPPPPDVQKTKPDPKWPSGVLSIILHQINNLERQNLKGASGSREGEAGQDTDEPSEQSDNLPSGYGEFLVNDDMVYKTRVKQYTTNPYFEAGTEVFVRDWQNTVVRLVVRDSRLREADPILGIVSVRLSEVFAQASSVTQVYAITEGVGFGKAHVSFAFRGMKTTLPPNMCGWDTGTLEVGDVRFDVNTSHAESFQPQATRLRVVTSESVEVLPKKEAEVQGSTIIWEMDTLRLPVYNRYQSSVIFEIGKSGGPLSVVGIGGPHPDAIAVLWLQDLTDDIEQEVKLPVIAGKKLQNLRQNVINDQTAKFHDFHVIGTLVVRLKLDSGLDEDHEKLRLSQSRRHAFEAYDHVEGEAEMAKKQAHFKDDGVIDKHEQKELDRVHKRQLESRGRGPAQIRAYRNAKWMMRGIKDRMPGAKSHTREPTVQSEA